MKQVPIRARLPPRGAPADRQAQGHAMSIPLDPATYLDHPEKAIALLKQ
jgi:hypothetical protein